MDHLLDPADQSIAEDQSALAENQSAPEQPPQSSPEEPKPKKKIEPKEIARRALIGIGILTLIVIVVFTVAYVRLARWVDKQLAAGPFHHAYNFYAAAESIAVGDRQTLSEVVAALRRSGLREGSANEPQTFTATPNELIVRMSAPVRIGFSGTEVTSIMDLSANRPLAEFQLPPQLITNYSEEGRAKRIMIHYSDLPNVLVQAVVSAEDKRFFRHGGLDVFRIVKALYIDLREHRKEQGASTITMQLARNLWLDRDKSWKRKISESLITVHLEHKLNKQKNFQYYCNTVYPRGRRNFSITRFREAGSTFFTKEK